MARGQRIVDEGFVHHVTGRSHAFAPAFPTAESRDRFLAILAIVVERFRWEVAALAVLSTHHHLLVRTPSVSLSDGMRLLHGTYGGWLSRRRGTRGPVWGDRFHSRPVCSRQHLLAAAVYVDANPVEAGLVKDPAAWRWSTFAANAGLADAAPWHCPALLDGVTGDDRAWYAALVRDHCARGVEPARGLASGRRPEA